MARKGSWIVDETYPDVKAKFCLNPPAQEGQCYAYVAREMSYDTDHVNIDALAFSAATFVLHPDRPRTLITKKDLDGYFSFLRQVANAVIVPSTQSTR